MQWAVSKCIWLDTTHCKNGIYLILRTLINSSHIFRFEIADDVHDVDGIASQSERDCQVLVDLNKDGEWDLPVYVWRQTYANNAHRVC